MDTNSLLEKYGETIAEEVNVKEVVPVNEDVTVSKVFVPQGEPVSQQFGKDTGKIIGAAKQGNVNELDDGKIRIYQGDDTWTLTADQYEVRYEGIDNDKFAVEGGVIVKLDTHITDQLKAEGVAREFSRFLNQLRKEADYQVDERVKCYRHTTSDQLQQVINNFDELLKQEALLTSLEAGSQDDGDITQTCTLQQGEVTFTLKK